MIALRKPAFQLFLFGIVMTWSMLASAGFIPVQPIISYQGQLQQGGSPHNGLVNMNFRMYNGESSDNQIGDTISLEVSVEKGLFQADLNFGPSATWDEARYLEVEIDGQILAPRQVLRPAPFALHALNATETNFDFPQGLDARELRLYNRSLGDIPVSPSRFTVASVLADGSAIPELRFHAPWHPALGDPGSILNLSAGGASFGSSVDPVNLSVGGNLLGFGNFTLIGGASFQGQAVFQNLVGMGTQTPGARLHVLAPASGPALRVQTSGGQPGLELAGNGRVGIGRESGISDRLHILAPMGEHAFRVQNVLSDGSGLTAFRVFDNSGVSVGANVEPPTRGLRVAGQSFMAGAVAIGTDAPTARLHVESGASGDAFRVRVGGNTKIFVDEQGGTTFGSTALPPPNGIRVAGVLRLNTLSNVGGSESLCRNNINNDVVPCSSSARFKKDIATLDPARAHALVEQLTAVSYRWIDSDLPDLGLVAEEVAEIEPRLAVYNADGQIEGVKYDRLTAVLVAALQEHKTRNAAEIAAIRADHAERMASLEQRLIEQQRQADERLAALEALMIGGKTLARAGGQAD